MLKMDFLGLANLTILDAAARSSGGATRPRRSI